MSSDRDHSTVATGSVFVVSESDVFATGSVFVETPAPFPGV
jgi:hypothetical protein